MANFVSPLKNGVAEGVASDSHDTRTIGNRPKNQSSSQSKIHPCFQIMVSNQPLPIIVGRIHEAVSIIESSFAAILNFRDKSNDVVYAS